MDINTLLQQLEQLIDEIEEKRKIIQKDTNFGIHEMPVLINKIQVLIPDWFYFIEQTEIGDRQIIVEILTDIANAMKAVDEVLLEDALVYGMQALMIEYRNVIKEALDGE